MSVAAPGRSANAGAIAVGIAQCVLLGLASLVVATWAFLELTKRLALSTDPLDSERVLFWSLVGAVAVLVLVSVAAAMVWRRRVLGFTVLALAWVPAAPLCWIAVASYQDLVVDDAMPGVVAFGVVAGAANVVLGLLLRTPTSSAHPPLAR
ncbi:MULTISPECIES: hypothetical protein [Mumia]|uniref:hypothetical protein n=1 Tax=Mumia TaxID=1546255 RepID=UPI00141FD011|nr:MULTISPECIES: hypothetical protein [unclassified Mumia]QMW67770.1 hypothetical protein H4N58_07885 [Mumia sp. ZJ1417]